jgi:hypothetical protein
MDSMDRHIHSPHGAFMATDVGAEYAINYPVGIIPGNRLNYLPFTTKYPSSQDEIIEQFDREKKIDVGTVVELQKQHILQRSRSWASSITTSRED